MQPMTTAPYNRPFLAQLKTRNGSATVFVRLRDQRLYPLSESALASNETPMWDVGSIVFLTNDDFIGWTDLPAGFDNPQIGR